MSVSEDAVMMRMYHSLGLESPPHSLIHPRTGGGWAGQLGKRLVMAHYLIPMAAPLIWSWSGILGGSDKHKKCLS